MRRFLHRRHDSDLYVVHDGLARRVEKRVRLEPALFDLRVVFGVPVVHQKVSRDGEQVGLQSIEVDDDRGRVRLSVDDLGVRSIVIRILGAILGEIPRFQLSVVAVWKSRCM